MSKIINYLLCLSGSVMMICAHAESKDPNAYALMTARDMNESALSNITITNKTGQAISVSGLFITSFDINDCSSCFGSIVSGDNVSGTMISPVTFKTNQALPIGQNYLYNMIYNGLYFTRTVGVSPCSLPGCSWPGDDTSVKGWCITMNVLSLDSTYTHSTYTNGSKPPANSPPFGAASKSVPFDYNYALVDPATLIQICLGPVTCDDKTLTCKVATAQNESFQPYSQSESKG